SGPSRSSSSRATLTISRARGLSSLVALEAIRCTKTVTQASVERDVESPRQGSDEVPNREDARRRQDGERRASPEPVHEVVGGHRPGMKLPPTQIVACPEEQGQVWPNREYGDLPVPGRVFDRL